jgi:hypothetical protein
MMDGVERFNHEEIAVTDKRKAYEEKFDAQLQEWNAQIRSLSIKMSLLLHHRKGSFSFLPHSASLVC